MTPHPTLTRHWPRWYLASLTSCGRDVFGLPLARRAQQVTCKTCLWAIRKRKP